MPHNPELDHEYREDSDTDEARKRAAHTNLFYMEMPDGNPMMNEPDPVDPERLAALRKSSKRPWRLLAGGLTIAGAILILWIFLYLIETFMLH